MPVTSSCPAFVVWCCGGRNLEAHCSREPSWLSLIPGSANVFSRHLLCSLSPFPFLYMPLVVHSPAFPFPVHIFIQTVLMHMCSNPVFDLCTRPMILNVS